MPVSVPTARARAEAARVVNERMGKLRISAAELRRLSGLSINTIRAITEGSGKPNRSTWVAVSAVLDLPWDYLVNILSGRQDKNVANSPLEKYLVDRLAEIDVLRQDVVGLVDLVHEIDRKIDIAIGSRHSSGDSHRIDPGEAPTGPETGLPARCAI